MRQRRLRRKKNISFRQVSAAEQKLIKEQEIDWQPPLGAKTITDRSLEDIERVHSISFDGIFAKLFSRFARKKIYVLDEGCGGSNIRDLDYLGKKNYARNLEIFRSDFAMDGKHIDKKVNVLGLQSGFGNGAFHLVVSTYGGVAYSPLPEKALFQVVSVLVPGGIGIVTCGISEERLRALEKRFGIKINKTAKQGPEDSNRTIIFTKNFGRRKGK